MVSPLWYLRIHESFDDLLRNCENSFVLVHSKLLLFKKSYTALGNIQTVNRYGVRIDRVIVAEALPVLIGSTIKLRYLYKIYNEDTIYHGEFKFDVVRKGKREIWAHKDDYYSSYEISRAYTSAVPSICIADNFEIAVTLCNLQGLVNFESIHWLPPLIENTAEILKAT